jgi:hypothetical protein
MAKKVVASLKKTDGKNYAKVIRAVRSEKTGAYIFKEEIVSGRPSKGKHWQRRDNQHPFFFNKITKVPFAGLFLFYFLTSPHVFFIQSIF